MTRYDMLNQQYETLRQSLERMSLQDPKRDARINQIIKLHLWLMEVGNAEPKVRVS